MRPELLAFCCIFINTDDLVIVWYNIQKSSHCSCPFTVIFIMQSRIHPANKSLGVRWRGRARGVGWWWKATLEENKKSVFLLLRNRVASWGFGLRSSCKASRMSGAGNNLGPGAQEVGVPAPLCPQWVNSCQTGSPLQGQMLPGEIKPMRWCSDSHHKMQVCVALPDNGPLSFVSYSCWIKDDSIFYTSVVAYFCLIFLMNLSMFCTVLAQLNSMNSQSQRTRRKIILRDLKGPTSLTFLLGLTWGFAFFAWGPVRIFFLYLFAIFNTLQGNICFFVLSLASQTSTKALLVGKIISPFGGWKGEKNWQAAIGNIS